MTKEEAIKAIEEYLDTADEAGHIFPIKFLTALDVAISALKGGWIPIEQRKPTEDGEYLLWGKISEDDENDDLFIGKYDACGEEFGWWEDYYDPNTLGFVDSEHFEYYEALAWQPLPEPYKKGEGKDEKRYH